MDFLSELLNSFSPSQDGFLFMWAIIAIAFVSFIIIVERWLEYRRRTNVNEAIFAEKIKALIVEKKVDEAYQLCVTGGKRALPSVLGSGIKMAQKSPKLVRSAMEGEFLKIIPSMDRRVNLILMFGNVSTMLGLMGTIYGLILSFSAVGVPGVSAVEKSSMLASGISTAMNTTLLGLIVSIPCIMAFAVFRARIDMVIKELDRYATFILRYLVNEHTPEKDYKFSGKRIKEEIDTEPNIGPMMSLIVILIPLLLSSAEFVKIGAIELNLPDGTAKKEIAEKKPEKDKKLMALNLRVEVKKDGFNILHHFKEETAEDDKGKGTKIKPEADISLKDGEYDFEALQNALAKVKWMALFELVKATQGNISKDISLSDLFRRHYGQKEAKSKEKGFLDHETIQIIANDAVEYQTLVSTMDAARNIRRDGIKIRMFPNVALSGGSAQ